MSLNIDVVDMAGATQRILEWSTSRSPHIAVGVNAHVCVQAERDSNIREAFQNADLVYADGQSVVWAARLLGTTLPERVATTDLIFPIAETAEAAGSRIFFYGSAPGVAAKAAERLRARYPHLQIEVSDGYTKDMNALVRRINDFDTNILFVGLGDPLQQQWVKNHRDQLQVGAIVTCGGLFDWTSGNNPRPPNWMVRGGLEWLWRTFIEPRRLAWRYITTNPVFVTKVIAQVARQRRFRRRVPTRSGR